MKRKITLKKMIILFCISLAISTTVNAADISSAGSGNWVDVSTWVGGVIPTLTDNVTIASGHTVSYSINNKTANITVDLCNNLTVEGILQISNVQSKNFVANIYGSVVCNGSIGMVNGTDKSAGTFAFTGTTAGFSGTGSASLRAIQMSTSVPASLLIDLPTINLDNVLDNLTDNTNITVAAGTTITYNTLSPTSLSCSGPSGFSGKIGCSMDIYGTVNCGTVYLCNGDTIPADKSRINIKNGGTLNVSISATPLGGNKTATIGGSGMNFSVESGGTFNFTGTATDPMLCTASSNPLYDPNLFIGYYAGSIINGTVQSSDQTGGLIPSGINSPEINTQKAYYNSTNNNLVLSEDFANVKIYTALGQLIVNQKYPQRKIAVPSSCKGICIVTMDDETGKSFSFKINVK